MKANKLDIVVVDDNDFYRRGLVLSLNRLLNIDKIHEFNNGFEFIKSIETIVPDIILMDIRMPVMDGITATRKAITNNRHLNIIALTMHRDEEYLIEMIMAGAKGFILKDCDEKEMLQAIDSVLSGVSYYSKSVLANFKLPNQ